MSSDVTKLSAKKVRQLALDGEVILLTPAGQAELALQAKAYDLEAKDLRKKLGESAKEYPDLAENATFDFLSAQLEHHLPKLQADLRVQMMKSQLYKERLARETVTFNSVCSLENIEGQEFRYWLAGPIEASANLEIAEATTISYLSPIGRAIWGAKLGDTVEVHLPARGKERFILYKVSGLS